MHPKKLEYLALQYPGFFDKEQVSDLSKIVTCGDGWFELINSALALVAQHVYWSRKLYATHLRKIRQIRKCYRNGAINLYAHKYFWHPVQRHEFLCNPFNYFKTPDFCDKVRILGIEEHLGDLQIRISGGDTYCEGAIGMAEVMSRQICETCGKPSYKQVGRDGKVRNQCSFCFSAELTEHLAM